MSNLSLLSSQNSLIKLTEPVIKIEFDPCTNNKNKMFMVFAISRYIVGLLAEKLLRFCLFSKRGSDLKASYLTL